MNFIDKKVSAKQVIAILAKNGIPVDDKEADVILDFLYLIAKNFRKPDDDQNAITLRRNRTFGKTL